MSFNPGLQTGSEQLEAVAQHAILHGLHDEPWASGLETLLPRCGVQVKFLPPIAYSQERRCCGRLAQNWHIATTSSHEESCVYVRTE